MEPKILNLSRCLEVRGCTLCRVAVLLHSFQLLAVWGIFSWRGTELISFSQLYATKDM